MSNFQLVGIDQECKPLLCSRNSVSTKHHVFGRTDHPLIIDDQKDSK